MLVRDLLASFPRLRVAVIGDALLDRFTIGEPSGLCRERPVPVLRARRELAFPGGAANVAANVRALGARTELVTALGDDDAGRALSGLLEAQGIGGGGIARALVARTGGKQRILAQTHYVVRIDVEAHGFDEAAVQRELIARLQAVYADCDAVIVSDYGGGAVGPGVLRALAALRAQRPVPTLVDARDLATYTSFEADIVTPNLEEAALFAGVRQPDVADHAALHDLARRVARGLRARSVVLTAGGEGVVLVRDGVLQRLEGRRVTVDNSCGAGDSFVAALALGLAAGADFALAASVGLEAAATAVAKPYTATVPLEELRERLDLLGTGNAVLGREDAAVVLERLRARRERGERIVFTNGVFDLLHAGHLGLLRRARKLGDVLVVALNSDRSARMIKGPHRPIADEEQRRAALEALDCVDEVVVFDEPSAVDLIQRIVPDVYARGDDRRLEELPEAGAAQRIGARVELLPLVGDLTTSRIIERISARAPHWSPLQSR